MLHKKKIILKLAEFPHFIPILFDLIVICTAEGNIIRW